MFKFYYWGPLLFHTKLDSDALKKIDKLCYKNEDLNHRVRLAGHIQGEYLINPKELEKVLENSFKKFNEAYQHWYNCNDDFYINSSWVNYMKKGEYNPVHTHDKCDLSAVLYLSVPDEIKKENETFVGTDLGPGSIRFIISSYTPGFISQQSFMPETGDMFIFPAHLMHMVAPFKSDVERVSVAFNMKRKI
tara:strand:- start:93 stop:665 length:573 start_codon:yes stop_codon:yes gene_type:complete